jgi:hypothetical protein
MLPLNFTEIQKFLAEKNVPTEFQQETDQLILKLMIAQKEFPLFIRIYDGGEMVQLLAFIPFQYKPETSNDMARLVCLLNKELDVPGFGMDEDALVVFFRAMIPVTDKLLESTFLLGFLNAVQLACQTFTPVIATVGAGNTTFAEVLKKAKEQHQKK